ncbi:ribose 5-phosphate isomerase B [bacterium]|nr:ribose 5-phosphate isomerase B [bacterium]
MRVAIASDHGGYSLKEYLKKELQDDYEFLDEGCFSEEPVDYPIYAKKVALDIQNGLCELGIVVCTTGIGVSITANKFKGVRCALCFNEKMALSSRTHNDANVLALGKDNQSSLEALKIVKIFLSTSFSNAERHARRVNIINNFEGE